MWTDSSKPLPNGGYAESLSMAFPNNAHFYNRNTPSKYDFDSNSESTEFSERIKNVVDSKVIAIGCSFTFGTGVKKEFSWPSIVEAATGEKVANFGMPGSSIGYEAAHVLHVLKNLSSDYKPDKIYALLPDLQRYFGITKREDGLQGFSPRDIPYHEHSYVVCTDIIMRGDRRTPAFKDYQVKDLNGNKYFLAPEIVGWTNFLLLDSLIAACKMASIDLCFSSWNYVDQLTFANLPYEEYKVPRINQEALICNTGVFAEKSYRWIAQYHGHGPRPWQQFGIKQCSSCNHEPQTSEQEQCWDIAIDGSHPGLHDHIHFAEFFTEIEITNPILATL